MVPRREEVKGMYTEDDLLPEENGPEPHFFIPENLLIKNKVIKTLFYKKKNIHHTILSNNSTRRHA